MLVLSRRPDEKIVLPTVPAIIKVVNAQSGLVRLGIEAPDHVPILREELCRGERARPAVEAATVTPVDDSLEPRYVLRNRLNNVILGLALLRMRLRNCDEEVARNLDGL